MSTRRGLILILTKVEDNWIYSTLAANHEVLTFSDFQQTVKVLNDVRCDLLIIDHQSLGDSTHTVIRHLKQYFPHFPIAVHTDISDDNYYERLITSGADLLLWPGLTTEVLQQQISIVLYRNLQRNALVKQSQRLYVISSLPLLLRNISNTREILFQAMKVVINFFDLQALTVVVDDGYGYRVSTGRKPLLSADQLAKTELSQEQAELVFWSIRHHMTLVYGDVTLVPYLAGDEQLDLNCAAIIIPFSYPGTTDGAMIFFLTPNTPVVNADISIFERFVDQFDALMLRTYQTQQQGRQLSLNNQLVDGWGAFAKTHTFEEVVSVLTAMIDGISNVQAVVVSCRDPQTLVSLIVDNAEDQLAESFRSTESQQLLESFQNNLTLDPQNSPMILLNEHGSSEAEQLRKLISSDRVILMPIDVSGEKMGVVLITLVAGHRPDLLEINLLENLTKIAINALQRITLRNLVLRNHQELMSIICSITEGVFYVDEYQKVTFYNPQLIELTSIEASEWVNQDVDMLLRAIAMNSLSPTQTVNQLQSARQRLIADGDEGDYPIISIPLAEQNIELTVEFVSIDNFSEKPSWLGIVHPVERSQGTMILKRSLERVRVSHSQLHSAVNTLAENHGHFSYGERNELLSQIMRDSSHAGKLWNQFSDLYHLNVGELSLRREPVAIQTLLEHILADIRISGAAGRVTVQTSSRSAVVKVDEFHFVRALSDLLAYLVDMPPRQAVFDLKMEVHVREVVLEVSSSIPLKPFGDLEEILSHSSYPSSGAIEMLDLYIGAEMIRRNGIQITIQPASNKTSLMQFVIPAIQTVSQEPTKTEITDLPKVTSGRPEVSNSAPSRTPDTILVVAGQSRLSQQVYEQLEAEGFSIVLYRSGAEAVRDVNSIFLDLIIVDLRLDEEDGFEICRRIRSRIETPIVIISDNASPNEKVLGLQAGADDVVTAPVTEEELLARVQVIVNRRYMVARTSQPILFGDLYVDFARRAVSLQNMPIELTRIEYDLLYTLIVNRGQTVTHRQLLTQVWGPEYQDESQYLWVNISRLRKKLGPNPESPRYIRTQSGVGYYFAVPD